GVSLGGGGKKVSQSRPFPGAIARDPWAREPPAYRNIGASNPWKTSKLTTTRFLISKLATARVLCFPAHQPTLTMCPHCHQGIYRWQQSQATRAATFPQRLRQWTYEGSVVDGRNC